MKSPVDATEPPPNRCHDHRYGNGALLAEFDAAETYATVLKDESTPTLSPDETRAAAKDHGDPPR